MGYGATKECSSGGDDVKGSGCAGCWGGSCSTKAKWSDKSTPDQALAGKASLSLSH